MGSRKRVQRVGVGHPQITDPESIRPGTPFTVDSYVPGESSAKSLMEGIFIGKPFSDDHGRAVKARVREKKGGPITVKVLRLGLDLGFYDAAYRKVYRLPQAPF